MTETARLTDDALAAIARTLDADHRASPSADTSRLILAELIERRAQDTKIRAALRAGLDAFDCVEAVFDGELGRDWADTFEPEYELIQRAKEALAHAEV